MRDWLVILILALSGIAMAYWLLRRFPIGSGAAGRADDDLRREATPREGGRTTVAPPPAAATIAMLEFDDPPRQVPVIHPKTVIGRHSEDDVRVPDVRISRHHARITQKGDGAFEIENLTAVRSEPNPMLINGEIREHAAIVDGDLVTLGGVSFTFRPAARPAAAVH